MRQVIFGVVAGIAMLPMASAQAADQDQSVVDQVQVAIQNANTPADVQVAIETMLKNAQSEAQKEAILSAAMSINAGNPAALAAIGNAANNAGVSLQSLTTAALTANVSPDAVLPATAAGNPGGNAPVVTPTTNNNPVVQSPSFGGSSGSGGGGTASPSA